MGMYIGITGWIADRKRGQQLAQDVAAIPMDRLMIETDAPFLLPRNTPSWITTHQPDGFSRNEPSFLHYVAKKLAECMSVSYEELCRVTTENAYRFFRIEVSI